MEPINNKQNSSLTLKEVIQNVQNYIAFLASKWLIIAIVCVVGFIIGYAIAFYTPKEFEATTTFILKEDQEGSSSQMNAALSAFGISSGSKGQQNYDKIVSIGKSRKIIYECLMHKLPQDSQLIANEYQKEFRFENKHIIPNVDSFGILDNKSKNRINAIYKKLLKESKVSVSYDQNSNILSCSSKSLNADVAYYFNKRHYENINDFLYRTSHQKIPEKRQKY